MKDLQKKLILTYGNGIKWLLIGILSGAVVGSIAAYFAKGIQIAGYSSLNYCLSSLCGCLDCCCLPYFFGSKSKRYKSGIGIGSGRTVSSILYGASYYFCNGDFSSLRRFCGERGSSSAGGILFGFQHRKAS